MNRDERHRRIESYGTAPQQVAATLAQIPRECWQFRPAPEEWSIHEQIIHLADSEAYGYIRLRHGISQPGSVVGTYNQAEWAKEMAYHAQNPDHALELFTWLRRVSYELIHALPDEAWANTFEHPERGTLTLDDWLVTYDNHVTGHIAQMRACYAAWHGGR
jgi:hypothetical protein